MWTVPLALFVSQAFAGSLEIYERAVSLVRHRYLDVEAFDPEVAFAEAAEAAEDAVPWLLVEADGGVATLRHGERGTLAVVSLLPPDAPEGSAPLDALPDALSRLEDAIVAADAPLPPDLDLPVALLRGVSHALDPHSVILARDGLERFDERIKGKLSGIGARVGREGEHLVLKDLFPDSPAAQAGLRRGDRVLRVDGASTVGMSTTALIDRIRGPVGSQLILEVGRPPPTDPEAEPEVLEMILTRAEVVIPNVTWEQRPSGVGLIRIDHFSEQTTALMRDALREFREAPAPLAGIVLDLRGNSGGSMQQACRAADLFLQDGVVLRTEGRDGKRVENLIREYRAIAEGVEPEVPVVVLMDHGSASASEILAGSLALLDRAVLLGTRSHGKGTVQKLYTLRGGDARERVRFKMTVARYRLPGDVAIESHVGLSPDLAVEKARFLRGGVVLPVAEDRTDPPLVWVDEHPGWREGVDIADREDVLEALAEAALVRTTGASRGALLAAVLEEGARLSQVEDARLVETFRYRGLDWSRSDEAGPAPDVDVEVSVVDDPVPGADVEVRALVHNRGPAPLYRVQVRLDTDEPLPWDDLTLPVGFLPPGETAMGSAMVHVGAGLAAREDEVAVTLLADGRPTVGLQSALLHVDGTPRVPLVVDARLVEGPAGTRVELELQNRGERHLSGVEARVALPEGAVVELLDSEALLPFLGAHESGRADVSLRRLREGPIALDLRVEDGLGRTLFRHTVDLGEDGVAHVSPPTLEAHLPRSAPTGGAELELTARDDDAVASVTVWLDRDKVAWRSADGPRFDLSQPLDVPTGTHAVTVEAVDVDGARTRQVLYIRGVDAVAAEQ